MAFALVRRADVGVVPSGRNAGARRGDVIWIVDALRDLSATERSSEFWEVVELEGTKAELEHLTDRQFDGDVKIAPRRWRVSPTTGQITERDDR